MNNPMNKNQGSVVIYIVLLIFVLMTSSAIVLANILSKHIRASENYLSSEQSFAAANSAVENMLYQISKGGVVGEVSAEGDITYVDGTVVMYKGDGCGVVNEDGQLVPRISASGVYKGLVRRIEFGGGSGGC
jgi:Tfp pilus assembly protein PilX